MECAWWLPAYCGPAVPYGNAGDRSMRELAVALHGPGLNGAAGLDYRGYGGNPGRPLTGLAAAAQSGCPASLTSTPARSAGESSARRWRLWLANGAGCAGDLRSSRSAEVGAQSSHSVAAAAPVAAGPLPVAIERTPRRAGAGHRGGSDDIVLATLSDVAAAEPAIRGGSRCWSHPKAVRPALDLRRQLDSEPGTTPAGAPGPCGVADYRSSSSHRRGRASMPPSVPPRARGRTPR